MDPTTSFDDIPRTIVSAGSGPEQATQPDTLGHYLAVVEGAEPGRLVEIGSEPLTIGRGARQGLVFPDDSELSRQHARVSLLQGEVVAEDLGSTNGTFVNAQRISAPVTLREGSVLRVGHQLFKYERRSRRDVERGRELDRDLLRASNYVMSMLPAPLGEGAVLAGWKFLPSAQLGGDAFGYYWLDKDTFIFYLMDVSGHGVGAAMHSVSVLNVLRQRALPQVDFSRPSEVLSSLNDRFQMDNHDGMYFTIWYGVYRLPDRTLTYSSAGHHPAYLLPPGRSAACPLGTPDLMIGAVPGHSYDAHQAAIPAGSTLHLFSDGVFEIVTKDARQWELSDFLLLLLAPALDGSSEPERLYELVRGAARPGPLEDDFSLLTVTFQ